MEQIKEFWRPVKGYRSFYEVSTLGRVKILGGGLVKKDRILKAKRYVNLSNGYDEKRVLIMDIVKEAFPNLFNLRMAIMMSEDNKIESSRSNVVIIERADEIKEREKENEVENQNTPSKERKKQFFKEHSKNTKGKWFNP